MKDPHSALHATSLQFPAGDFVASVSGRPWEHVGGVAGGVGELLWLLAGDPRCFATQFRHVSFIPTAKCGLFRRDLIGALRIWHGAVRILCSVVRVSTVRTLNGANCTAVSHFSRDKIGRLVRLVNGEYRT